MGPTALFDKSFLQSLSLDESVWFDHFFIPNVCPLFYIETLADLEKPARKGKTSDQEVRVIADKFPEMSSAPNAFHLDLCLSNLMGINVPMTGQILFAGSYFVKENDKTGAVLKVTREADAFSRWQKQEFEDIERLYAKIWRTAVTSIDLNEVAKSFKTIGIDGKTCRSLEDAKAIADEFIWNPENPFERIRLAITFLNIPIHLHSKIIDRFSIANYPPLASYAPYAAYVLSVEIFFQVALAANLISPERPSNRTDIAYLFYLPFCMVFISSDNLHKKCAPIFLRSDQSFIWGPNLKEGLKKANTYYFSLQDSIKEKGVMSFAGYPPESVDILANIWDRHLPKWRHLKKNSGCETPYKNEKLAKELKKYSNAKPLSPDQIDFNTDDIDILSIERRVRKRKGSWWQLPKNIDELRKKT